MPTRRPLQHGQVLMFQFGGICDKFRGAGYDTRETQQQSNQNKFICHLNGQCVRTRRFSKVVQNREPFGMYCNTAVFF